MGGNWWTGLTDKENESNWKWPHSQKMAIYTSWKSGQPNGAINRSVFDLIPIIITILIFIVITNQPVRNSQVDRPACVA